MYDLFGELKKHVYVCYSDLIKTINDNTLSSETMQPYKNIKPCKSLAFIKKNPKTFTTIH
jgi:hypothetical protein